MRTAIRTTLFARDLRVRMTEAESRLWLRLRRRELRGWRFRRQHPVGPYIVDFACLDAGLVVELDGSQHLLSRSDARRDACLRRKGFRVLRFWNDEVLVRLDDVLEAILRVLEDQEQPPSPPSGELPPLRGGSDS
jgi:very-short-patch-repair endonuclease